MKGGRASMQIDASAVALVLSVRNVGSGLAVLHGWSIPKGPQEPPADPADFRRLTRDIYVSTQYVGFVQVAIRDPESEEYRTVVDRVRSEDFVLVDVLYGDAEGTQRVISRFSVSKGPAEHPSDDGEEYFVTVSRHWNIDLPSPRG